MSSSSNMALRSRRKTPERWHNMGTDPQLESSTSGPHVPLWPRNEGGRDSDEDSGTIESGDGAHHHGPSSTWEHLRGDYGNIGLLLFLYLLQGIPIGLTASIPLVLQSRHVSYAQQAVFSFAYWPFSLKLLWAPIVDSIFLRRLGRRKSWLVPTQYLIALFMFVLSGHVTKILGDDIHGNGPNVYFLTSIFFSFNFLAATQDIAVDGWALTMLSRRNVGYASTCNAVGQTAGFFLGNVVFLSLESADFCNKYLRSVPQKTGVVTLADFVYMWAWVFLVTTTMVLLLKHERDESVEGDEDLGVKDTYFLLWKIIKLKPVLTLLFVHLTAKVAFAAADAMTGLKLVDLGVPKDKLALIAVPLVPLQVVLPWILGKYTSGPRPLNVYLKAYPFRIVMSVVFAFVVHWTPAWKQADDIFPISYYIIIILLYCLHQVTVYSIFVSQMAFHAQISDPLVGGTYMTLLNTLANLGGNWPTTATLSVVDDLTWKTCVVKEDFDGISKTVEKVCVSDELCKSDGGQCRTDIDGYYILSAACAIVGLIWWRFMRKRVEKLQDVDKRNWSCTASNNNRR